MTIHDPDYPDVDPDTGDEAETENNPQQDRLEHLRWRDWMME